MTRTPFFPSGNGGPPCKGAVTRAHKRNHVKLSGKGSRSRKGRVFRPVREASETRAG